jgi:hypothetical protein
METMGAAHTAVVPPVNQGAAVAVQLATLPADGPTGAAEMRAWLVLPVVKIRL